VSTLKWVVGDSNRQSLDIAFGERIVISRASQEREDLTPSARRDVGVVSYYGPSHEDRTVQRGLVLLNDVLYCCVLLDREVNWLLAESTCVTLERLHRLAKGRHRSYKEVIAT